MQCQQKAWRSFKGFFFHSHLMFNFHLCLRGWSLLAKLSAEKCSQGTKMTQKSGRNKARTRFVVNVACQSLAEFGSRLGNLHLWDFWCWKCACHLWFPKLPIWFPDRRRDGPEPPDSPERLAPGDVEVASKNQAWQWKTHHFYPFICLAVFSH